MAARAAVGGRGDGRQHRDDDGGKSSSRGGGDTGDYEHQRGPDDVCGDHDGPSLKVVGDDAADRAEEDDGQKADDLAAATQEAERVSSNTNTSKATP